MQTTSEHTTTKLAAQRGHAYAPSLAPQDLELVARYPTPIVRLRVKECISLFVALANAGFFAVPGEIVRASSAEGARETLGTGDGDLALGAWSIRLVGVSAEGLGWLAQALEIAGTHVEHWSVGVSKGEAGLRLQTVARTLPFRTISRRGHGGYYLRLTLGRTVGDQEERAFRRVTELWMALVRALPARDGRGRANLTVRPSYERGGNVLAVAGRELDASTEQAAAFLLGALAQFNREVVPVVEVLAELA